MNKITNEEILLSRIIHNINGLWKPTPLHTAGTTKQEHEYNAGLIGAIQIIADELKSLTHQ